MKIRYIDKKERRERDWRENMRRNKTIKGIKKMIEEENRRVEGEKKKQRGRKKKKRERET